ncbi:putative nucleotide-diphospho-sugar transferase [Paracoccus sp. NSM]|uniref:putative nucleotide-diphospho-sugar transferase n=1 Tax=Paracoccus sp. NSM TaxID=3457784 RepID=UPI00403749A5
MDIPVIVTFANAGYIPVLRNWLAYVRAAGVRAPVQIVALDGATRDAFAAEQVLYRPCDVTDKGALWSLRIAILRDILAAHPALIHSDADAVWQHDPLPMIEAADADMTFSQGTIWPPDIHARHGLVLCCGFFHLRNNTSVHHLLAQFEARVGRERDDQVALNRLLDESGLDWRIDNPYRIAFRDTSFVASRQIIRTSVPAGGDRPVSIAVLPHHLFPRQMTEPDPQAIVAHPVAPQNGAEKIAMLARLGLWR